MIELMGVVLLALLLHAALFLGAAWLLERMGWVREVRAREFLWRSAVIGGGASAVLQLVLAFSLPSLLPVQLSLPARGASGDVQGEAPMASEQAALSASAQAPAAQHQNASTTAGSAPQRVAAAPLGAAAPPSDSSATPRPSAAVATPHTTPIAAAESSDASLLATADRVLAWLPRLLPLVLLAWLLGTLWHALRLLLSARALRRLQREAAPLELPPWQQDVEHLAQRFGMAPPPLRVAGIASPLATPGGLVLVPRWALTLPPAQRRAMLAHEFSHLRRRDPLWRLGVMLWCGLLWPLPLSALARQRLEALAEFECDAAAARALGDGRPLAECLALCLEQRLDPGFPAFAAAMAAPRSPLLQRAERLLEGVSMNTFKVPLRTRALPLVAVIVAVLAVPVFVVPASFAAEKLFGRLAEDCDTKSGSCVSIHSRNSSMNIVIADDGRRLEFSSQGKVQFDAEDAVASVAPGGKVVLQETAGGVTRKVEYTGGDAGLQVRYWRDGTEQAPDADAKAWIARTVPQLLRESAVNVEARVARLHQRGGARAVLADVALIQSDYSRGRHLAELLKNHSLDAAELDLALAQVDKIGSDYERRQVLSATLQSQRLGTPQLAKVFESTAGIGSDYERAELLVQTADRVGADAQLREAWLKAAQGIGSDYEHRRSLEALVGHSKGDDAALLQILEQGGEIGSDYEQRELLSEIAGKAANVDTLAPHYAKVAGRIGSDFERREALVALVRGGELGRDGALAVLDAAAGIGSDFECREVLVELARKLPDDAAVRQKYLDVAGKLSDFERTQAEKAAGLARG